jgi:tetratricopeptide (TPR) repeat protein
LYLCLPGTLLVLILPAFAIFASVTHGDLLGPLAISVIFYVMFYRFGIILHEIGHLLFAKAAGGTPWRIVLGHGAVVDQVKVAGVKIFFCRKFDGGLAYADFRKSSYRRLRHFMYTLGGPLTNVLLGLALWLPFGFSLESVDHMYLTGACNAWIAAHFTLAAVNLIPVYSMRFGMKLRSDGLGMIMLLFGKQEVLTDYGNTIDLLKATDLYDEKRYDEALVTFEERVEKYPKGKNLRITLAMIYIKLLRFKDARECMRPLYNAIDPEKPTGLDGIVLNNYAWICIFLGDLELAGELSERAYTLDQKTHLIRGTRGVALAELGEYKRAKMFLSDHVDLVFASSESVMASAYFAFCERQLGDVKTYEKYMKFADKNVDCLESDGKVLYQQLKARVAESETGN